MEKNKKIGRARPGRAILNDISFMAVKAKVKLKLSGKDAREFAAQHLANASSRGGKTQVVLREADFRAQRKK